MKTRPYLLLLLCIGYATSLIGVCNQARASEQPTWVLTPPLADTGFYYYVGSSSDSKTLEEAKEEAYKNAVNDAIRDRYGVVTQIENEQYLTDANSHATTRIRESSSSVRIRAFEKLDTFVEKRDGHLHVSALYRYSKTEVALEKKRLNETAPLVAESIKTIEGTTFTTDLALTSEPTGATVWINDLPLGQTPLKIKGLLPPGPVHVKFDQPFFETEVRELVLISGETSEVQALLRPSHAQLVFEELPANTDILIDRQTQKADLRKFELIAGRKYRIEVRNANYQPMLFEELVFDRNETKTISTPLIPKPARLKISTLPSNAQLNFNGRDVGFAPYSDTILPGSYNVLATAVGYTPTQITIDVKPNDNVTHVIRLSKESPRRLVSNDAEQRRIKDVVQPEANSEDVPNLTLLNLGLEGAGPQFTQIAIPMGRVTAIAKTIGRSWFGYGLGLSLGTGEGRIGQYDVTVNEQIGVRLNLNHEFQIFSFHIEVGAEPGYHSGEILLKQHGSDTTVSRKTWTQSSMGGYLGLNIYPENGGLIQVQIGARDYSGCGSLQGANTLFLNFSWGGFL